MPAAVPRGTVTAQLSSRGDRPSTSLDSAKEGPRAADHQDMAVNRQPHTFALDQEPGLLELRQSHSPAKELVTQPF